MNPEKYVKKTNFIFKDIYYYRSNSCYNSFLFGYHKEINGIALGITAGFFYPQE